MVILGVTIYIGWEVWNWIIHRATLEAPYSWLGHFYFFIAAKVLIPLRAYYEFLSSGLSYVWLWGTLPVLLGLIFFLNFPPTRRIFMIGFYGMLTPAVLGLLYSMSMLMFGT